MASRPSSRWAMAVSGCSNSPEASVAFCKTGTAAAVRPPADRASPSSRLIQASDQWLGCPGRRCKAAMTLSISGSWAASGPSNSPRRRMAKRRAAHDLLRLDGKQVGRLDDPALRDLRRDVDLPLPQEHGVGQLAQRGLQPADLPGGRLLRAEVGTDRLKDHLGQPRGKGLVEFQGGRVMGQGLRVLAHLVIALALHRFVADRVDPARLRGLDRRAGLGLEMFQGRAVVAVVEVGERGVIALGRHRCGRPAVRPERAPAWPAAGRLLAQHRQNPAEQEENERDRDETHRDSKKCEVSWNSLLRDPVRSYSFSETIASSRQGNSGELQSRSSSRL